MKGRTLFYLASSAIVILGVLLSRPDNGLLLAIWVMLMAIFWMLDDIRKEMK